MSLPYDNNGSTSTPGGLGPAGGQGGTNSPSPYLPAPDLEMFKEPKSDLGSSAKGGVAGGQTLVPEIPGDLGTRYKSLNKFLLLTEATRTNSTFNGLTSHNMRYRGHREATKFNLVMQKMVRIALELYLQLKEKNTSLTTSELDDMYPTDTEIQNIYHIRAQVRFKEWNLLKDSRVRWFNG